MRFPLAVAFVSLAAVSVSSREAPAQPGPGTADAVQSLAADLAKHPQSEAEDLYKFLHQANFGPGHAIPDPGAAEEYLRRELAGLTSAEVLEARCDILGGDPRLVRVNLRPFVRGQFDSGALVESFVATANEVQGNPRRMGEALDLVVKWLGDDGRTDLARALSKLAGEMKGRGYPAIHHSAVYSQTYQPAYRVVTAALAAAHGWCG